MHLLCTICSDLMNQSENISVIKCGHLFHYKCIIEWINRSKTCPQCRIKVTEKCMFRMYPTISNENADADVTTLQSRLDNVQLQLRQERAECKERDKKMEELNKNLRKIEDSFHNSEKKLVEKSSAVAALKEKLLYVQIQNQEVNKLKAENESLNKQIKITNDLQKVLNACSEDVEQMLEDYDDIRTLAIFATALKRTLRDTEKKKNEYRDRVRLLNKKLAAEKTRADTITNNFLLQMAHNTSMTSHDCTMTSHNGAMTSHSGAPRLERREVETAEESFVRPESLVSAIEQSDSPYLLLKQSSLPLTALQRRPIHQLSDRSLKPSELAILNTVNAAVSDRVQCMKQVKDSILHRKVKPVANLKENESQLNISYDGLGGHSKLDVFPKPKAVQSCVPRLTTRHKLKRPSDQPVQAIKKYCVTNKN